MADIKITLDKLKNRDQIAKEKFPNGRLKTTRSEDYEAGEIDNPISFNMISGSEALLASRVQLDPVELSAAYERIATGSAARLFNEENYDPSNLLPPGVSMDVLLGGELEQTQSIASVVSLAEGEIGTTEGPGNNENPYAIEVGHAQGQRWCATFIAWLFKEAGIDDPVIGSASTQEMLANAKNISGRFDSKPKIGDVIFFKYTEAPTSHVELVVEVAGSTVKTVGGNTTEQGNPNGPGTHGVYRKSYPLTSSKIVGFYHPAYPQSSNSPLSGGGATLGSGAVGDSGSYGGIEISGFGNPLSTMRVTSGFGPRSRGTHKGVDLGCAVGTPVFAAKGGRVLKAALGTGYGNVIYIDHGDGTQTRYAHLSGFSVSAQDTVSKGQQIGLSGGEPGTPGAGTSSGPHLHFEIRVGSAASNTSNSSTPVDPEKYIPG